MAIFCSRICVLQMSSGSDTVTPLRSMSPCAWQAKQAKGEAKGWVENWKSKNNSNA